MRMTLTMTVAILALFSTCATAGDWDNPEWEPLMVDSFGGLSTNTGLSVAVDSHDRPHVAYYALRGADLRYAVRTGTTWSTETVDDHQVVGPDCSIALDGDDLPHICYYDKTNEELEYARRNGTGWDIETVDWLGIVGVGTSIAIGPDGDPYMAYVGARTLRCAHRAEDGWNITLVDEVEGHIYTPSVTVDDNGDPHILYFGVGTVKHAFRTDGNWTLEQVDELRAATIAMRTTILVDPDGDLVACYANDAGTSVIIARRSGGEWTKEKVSQGHYLGDLDMEMDASGQPRVALIDLAFNSEKELVNTDVWYLEREGTSWTRGVVVSSSGRHGVLLDLHLDGEGEPSLAVVDLDPAAMKADLTHFTGWTGTFIESYTGDGSNGGGGNGGDGSGEDDTDTSFSMMAPLAIAITALVLVVVFLTLRNDKA